MATNRPLSFGGFPQNGRPIETLGTLGRAPAGFDIDPSINQAQFLGPLQQAFGQQPNLAFQQIGLGAFNQQPALTGGISNQQDDLENFRLRPQRTERGRPSRDEEQADILSRALLALVDLPTQPQNISSAGRTVGGPSAFGAIAPSPINFNPANFLQTAAPAQSPISPLQQLQFRGV